jgi:hypothetical protein
MQGPGHPTDEIGPNKPGAADFATLAADRRTFGKEKKELPEDELRASG